MNDYLEYEIRATDITINEANGNFSNVAQIMLENSIVKQPSWVLRSDIGIDTAFGYNQMTCQFHHDAKVYIVDYMPIIKDVYYNLDIRCLAHWCQSNGWSRPEPTQRVIDERQDFWKHQWLTHIIDSEYLDKKFGTRADDTPGQNKIEEDDDE